MGLTGVEFIVANTDLQALETSLAAVADAGYELVRAHPYKPDEKHGYAYL